MRFISYPSIGNSTPKTLKQLAFDGLMNEACVVQEKLHGANISFWTDGVRVQAAKRTKFLKTKDSFFGFQTIFEEIKDQVLSLFEDIKQQRPLVQQIGVFGELVGGSYPHPDVPQEQHVKKIQKEVFYTPSLSFFAFDILVGQGEGGQRVFLPIEEALVSLASSGIPTVPILFRGTLKECLEYDNEFVSRIPAQQNLPPIEGNICEGTIIRSVSTIEKRNGSRLILKNKNERFLEVVTPKPKKKVPTSKKNKRKSALVQDILSKIESRINTNRWQNTISKVGELDSKKKQQQAKKMFEKDVWKDFQENYLEDWMECSAKEQYQVKQIFKQQLRDFFADH